MLYALQNNKKQILESLNKTTTTTDAEKLVKLLDKAEGFNSTHKCMQKLLLEADKKIKIVNYNKKELTLVLHGALLPEWRNYLSPEISNR